MVIRTELKSGTYKVQRSYIYFKFRTYHSYIKVLFGHITQ